MKAVISECGLYRFSLERDLGVLDTTPRLFCFIGVNPSTADAEIDDPTTNKWKRFTVQNGGTAYIAVNIFGYRAADVNELKNVRDPVGLDINDKHVFSALRRADVIVPCWGAREKIPKSWRSEVENMIGLIAAFRSKKEILCFGRTKSGDPKHPLFLSYDTELVPFL